MHLHALPKLPRSVAYRRRGVPAIAVMFVLLATFVATAPLALAQKFPVYEFPKTNTEKSVVELSEIMSGGPPRDGIPAVDEPKYVSLAEADEWLAPDEPVIAVVIDEEARAYPLQILIWHEIANDELAGVPIAVTFCPLCNSSIVFARRFRGEVLDFGTTGRLRLSDLVMYDRQTETWWQQLTGTGLIGEYAGEELERLPARIVAWQDFRASFPAGTVLSRETGYRRNYGKNPYVGYDSMTQPFLLRGTPDPRLPAMERVLHVIAGGSERIYPFGAFDKSPVVLDELGGEPVAVFSRSGTRSALDANQIADSRRIPSAAAYLRRLDDGRVLNFELRGEQIVDTETQSFWNLFGEATEGPLAGQQLMPLSKGAHFAFAWLAFHPDADVYGQ